jgi:hypothetical protein
MSEHEMSDSPENANDLDPNWIKLQFRRQLRRVLIFITAPIFLLAVVNIFLFHAWGATDAWFIWPLLLVSLLGGLIGGSLLCCPNCRSRQPFRTGFRTDNVCRKCGANLC